MAKRTMTLQQVAKYLHMGEKTVLDLATSERIPGRRKQDDEWVFDQSDVDAWLELQRAAGAHAFDKIGDGANVPLGELLTDDGIITELRASDALGAIEELAARAYSNNWLRNKPWFIGALIERESLASTALEGGVAFLHTREKDNGKIKRPFIVLGRSHKGIDFGAPDGKPTYLFFLLGLKYDKMHLPILGRLARTLKSPTTVATLRSTTSIAKIRSVLFKEDDRARKGKLNAHVEFPDQAELKKEIRKRAIMRAAMAQQKAKSAAAKKKPAAKKNKTTAAKK